MTARGFAEESSGGGGFVGVLSQRNPCPDAVHGRRPVGEGFKPSPAKPAGSAGLSRRRWAGSGNFSLAFLVYFPMFGKGTFIEHKDGCHVHCPARRFCRDRTGGSARRAAPGFTPHPAAGGVLPPLCRHRQRRRGGAGRRLCRRLGAPDRARSSGPARYRRTGAGHPGGVAGGRARRGADPARPARAGLGRRGGAGLGLAHDPGREAAGRTVRPRPAQRPPPRRPVAPARRRAGRRAGGEVGRGVR